MAEPMPLKGFDVTPSQDGSTMTWTIVPRDGPESSYIAPSDRLPLLIGRFMAIAAHPDVRKHFAPSEPLTAGATANLVAIPFEDFAAAFVETTGNLGLVMCLPGSLKLAFEFSPAQSKTLFEMLQAADRESKIPGNKPTLQ